MSYYNRGRASINLMPDSRKKFSKIYDQYINKIYRFILLKVSSQEIAEDLTSETFLRLMARCNNLTQRYERQPPEQEQSNGHGE